MITQCCWCRFGHSRRFRFSFGGKFKFCRNRWHGLWVVLQESCVLGVSPKTGEVRVVMLFDKGTQLNRYFLMN